MQCWFQAVVCVSTPRMYPHSGYFLVNWYFWQNLRLWSKYLFQKSQCFGTPSKCQDCTEICTFEEGEQKAVVKSSDFLGSDNMNGECVYDCNPDGADPRYPEIPACRVEFKPHGVYSGDVIGLCFFSDNSCCHTPSVCQNCNQHCNINPLNH